MVVVKIRVFRSADCIDPEDRGSTLLSNVGTHIYQSTRNYTLQYLNLHVRSILFL
jgi:hypothetical protein